VARPQIALADCASPEPLGQALQHAGIVVVGTVVELENDGRWAFFRVEERWRGPTSVDGVIQVRGGPGPGEATAIDRSYTGGRYLLFLTEGASVYLDNACSLTRRWTEDLTEYRPGGVVPALSAEPAVVVDGPSATVNVVPVAALGFFLAITLVSYAVILRGRRRPPDWMR
jgi:hypothetical protein